MKTSNKDKISQDEDNLCNSTAEEGAGTDRRGPAGDGAMCRGDAGPLGSAPVFICVLVLCRRSQSPAARLPAAPLQVNNMCNLLFSLQNYLVIVSWVYVEITFFYFLFCFIFSVCSEACFEGDPFVSNQRHQGKPAP